MARLYKNCIHCRRLIMEPEVKRGSFVATRYGMLCPECAQKLEQEAPPEPEPQEVTAAEKPAAPEVVRERPPETKKPETASRAEVESLQPAPVKALVSADVNPVLEKISTQIDLLQRTLSFEKSSAWNVLGAVAQCVAAGVFALALLNWLEEPQKLLLAGVLLQVMALTFFVKGK